MGKGSPQSDSSSGQRRAGSVVGSPTYEPGELSRRALQALGLNIEAPVRQYRAAYERFLPEAADVGLYRLLIDRLAERDEQGELHWLAQRLVVHAPERGDEWWSRLWDRAAAQLPSHCSPPQELGLDAREVLLHRLVTAHSKGVVVDALAAAMRAETRC